MCEGTQMQSPSVHLTSGKWQFRIISLILRAWLIEAGSYLPSPAPPPSLLRALSRPSAYVSPQIPSCCGLLLPPSPASPEELGGIQSNVQLEQRISI